MTNTTNHNNGNTEEVDSKLLVISSMNDFVTEQDSLFTLKRAEVGTVLLVVEDGTFTVQEVIYRKGTRGRKVGSVVVHLKNCVTDVVQKMELYSDLPTGITSVLGIKIPQRNTSEPITASSTRVVTSLNEVRSNQSATGLKIKNNITVINDDDDDKQEMVSVGKPQLATPKAPVNVVPIQSTRTVSMPPVAGAGKQPGTVGVTTPNSVTPTVSEMKKSVPTIASLLLAKHDDEDEEEESEEDREDDEIAKTIEEEDNFAFNDDDEDEEEEPKEDREDDEDETKMENLEDDDDDDDSGLDNDSEDE